VVGVGGGRAFSSGAVLRFLDCLFQKAHHIGMAVYGGGEALARIVHHKGTKNTLRK